MKDNQRPTIKDFFSFMTSKLFLKQLLLIILFYLAIALILLLWLRVYTHHGQKLRLPDYRYQKVEMAMQKADDDGFEIIVDDSLFVVGKEGGLIIDQNPKVGSMVKQNRKIYVVITKHDADKIKMSDIPRLYGASFDVRQKELELMGIKSRIIGYMYDKSDPNNILKVYYNGRIIVSDTIFNRDVEIPKGGTLDFILSKKSGGDTELPDLKCKSGNEAVFLLESGNFDLGILTLDGVEVKEPSGYVISQNPPATNNLPMHTKVDLELSSKLPADCR